MIGAGDETPAEEVDHYRREGVEEEGGELVEAVKHQTVLPDDDGEHEWAHTQNIIRLKTQHVQSAQKFEF